MVYDCFTFFNELDLLEIRLNTLNAVVDRFVIAEATRTYRGQPKELLFEKNRARYAAFADKIVYLVVDDLLPEEEVARDIMNLPWVNENRQRNALVQGLVGAKEDDVILVSDVDEIPRPDKVVEAARLARHGEVVRLVLDVFTYYANMKDYRTPHWYLGTQVISFKTYADDRIFDGVVCDRFTTASECAGNCLQKVRFLCPTRKLADAGWHLTYLGGLAAVRCKLQSFSHAEAAHLADTAEERLRRGENVIGGHRDAFGVPLDARFPHYLIEHADRFDHLLFHLPDGYLRQTRFARHFATLRGRVYRALVALVPKCLEKPLSGIYRKIRFR